MTDSNAQVVPEIENSNTPGGQIEKLKKIEGQAKSLMEEVIEDYPESIKKKVRGIVKLSGINEKDPLFLILLVCRITHVLIEDAPEHIAKSFETGRVGLIKLFDDQQKKLLDVQGKSLDLHRQAALDLTVAKITTILDKELKQRGLNDKRKISPEIMGLITAGTTAVISLVIGFSAGWSFDRAVLAKDNLTRLSSTEQIDLKWLQSKEGQLARNILAWNEDLADKSCASKVRDLNVTIAYGAAKAVSGYCWVWIEPPSHRRFSR